MNIRYGRAFKAPRKIIKELLSAVYPVIIKIWPLPKVLSIDATLDRILENKFSICRFGDSEFLYIIDRLNLPYQEQVPELRRKLIDILKSDTQGIKIGLPIGYYSLQNLKINSKKTWRSQISWIYPRLRKYLNLDKAYFNASMTRLYMDYDDTSGSSARFEKIKKIWEGREILLIEGEKSRLGIGNDLFEKATSISRILGPATNAFSRFDDLLYEAMKQPRSKLVLAAMGPTAKPLVYELAKAGFQAIDIGNIDIEYEWYLRDVREKIRIPGKYTSEAIGGRKVEEMNDPIYDSQVIAKL